MQTKPIQPTDLHERLIDLRRKSAAKPSSQPARAQPDPEDFSRRLRISEPTAPPSKPLPKQPKLFDPERDPIPVKRTSHDDKRTAHEQERIPDRADRARTGGGSPRQLFDHRRDDPVGFAGRKRPKPTPKYSGDHFSATSASSYAPSVASSSFTLSSTTDGSSTPSVNADPNAPSSSDEGNIFVAQLKKLYRTITVLETKIKTENETGGEEENSRVVIKSNDALEDDSEKESWRRRLADHKEYVPVSALV